MLPSLIAITTSYFNVTFPHCHYHFILQCYLPSLSSPLHTSMLTSLTAITTSYFNATFPHCHHHFILQCYLPSLPLPLHTSMLPSLMPLPLHTSMLPSLIAITTSYFNATFPHCQHHFLLQCVLPSLPISVEAPTSRPPHYHGHHSYIYSWHFYTHFLMRIFVTGIYKSQLLLDAVLN